jgi:hypothetical protein
MRTLLRRRKSAAGSLPVIAGVPRLSLAATDAAREVAGREGSIATESFGVAPPFVKAKGVEGILGIGVAGPPGSDKARAGALGAIDLFRAMIAVNSFLNRSRSWYAMG